MNIEKLHVSKRRLLAMLPEDGAPGRALYTPPGGRIRFDARLDKDEAERLVDAAAASRTGAAVFEYGGGAMLIAPPFPIERAESFDAAHTAPLVELLEKRRSYAVFLLRLGGFAVGFFRGDALVDSKVDQRFVKGRHRKGGQSSTRFARIREKQVHELFAKACEASANKLAPYESEIEHVFFGGDRRTLQAFRKECAYFDRFGDRLMDRLLPAHGDPRLAMLASMPHEVWSSDVWRPAAGDS
jgi:hypothetical protein